MQTTFWHMIKTFCFLFLLHLFLYSPAYGLEPYEILVVANKNASQSIGLARYYMKKRQIPEQNLVQLFITDKEDCTRDEYVRKAVPPIKRFLDTNSDIRAIVTMYGVPLRIPSPAPTKLELVKKNMLEAEKNKLESDLSDKSNLDPEKEKTLTAKLKNVKKNLGLLAKLLDKTASFDSELALIKKESYELNMWQLNPFYIGFQKKKLPVKKSEVLMVSRLDASNAKIVKRIINDSIEAEKNGLKGVAYFDARWPPPKEAKTAGYGYYDQSLHRAALRIQKDNRLKTVIDSESGLFQKGQCPDTALYCGWYSLSKYIDAFTWQKGSVGYHIASAECTTLKKTNSNVWCKKILDNGAAATIGPVGEPYVQAFPVPEVFFDFLSKGEMTLAESYLISIPYFSWKMVLIGDPLYRLNLKK